MMMILYLFFLGVCACQTTPGPIGTTQYYTISKNLKEVEKLLQDNVGSLINVHNLPALNDSRSHYAEIVHVLHSEAKGQSGCLLLPYYENYQNILDGSAPDAIKDPKSVAVETEKFIFDFKDKVLPLQLIVDDKCKPDVHPQVCNLEVDTEVQENKNLLDLEVQLFKAGGKVAEEYLALANEFAAVSKDLGAHKYVINGAEKLEKVVKALGNVLRVLEYRAQKC